MNSEEPIADSLIEEKIPGTEAVMKVSPETPSIIAEVLARHGLDASTGTAEIRDVRDEPGVEDGQWVYWNGDPLERIGEGDSHLQPGTPFSKS